MNVARVRNGIVVNIEVMDADWFAGQQLESSDLLIPYEHPENPFIGLSYDADTGEWEQPLPEILSDPITDDVIPELTEITE